MATIPVKLSCAAAGVRRYLWPLLGLLLILACPGPAHAYPWPDGETLNMEIYWPSGASMGEATLRANTVDGALNLSASVEVVMPQGRIRYQFSSLATSDLCSREFHRSVQRGVKSWEEVTRFDPDSGKASVSRDGTTREMDAPKCARDPLTFLYYYRAQAAAGKHPSVASLFLAGPLELAISAPTGGTVKINRFERRGDHYLVGYPGADGSSRFELWLDGNPRQTPIAVRLPLPLATFSAELR